MKRFEPTPEQLAVIAHRGSHALVFAGPGTGKTETLARRFASLVVDDGVDPSAILVLTFSRRAAEQMLERVVQRLRERTGTELAVSELFVKTFHSFCSRLLDGDGPRSRERDLLTPIKERVLWKRVVARATLQSFDDDVRTSPAFAADALNLIAQLKGQGITPSELASVRAQDTRLGDIAELYRLLDADRVRLSLSDFRDLVKDALAALEQPESPAARWLRQRGGFAHILVDEFQDSDRLQLQLLEALAGDGRARANPTPEICFVGDFNQSIYRFRGATPENIAAARSAFACSELTLRTNRRSAQAVLDVANKTPRLDPQSLTQAEDPTRPGSVRLVRAASPEDEIAFVGDSVARHIAAGTAPGQIAVLLRAGEPYTSRIAAALDDRGIAIAARPAAGFLEDPAVGAVLTAMRLCADDQDEALWTRLLVNPIVGYRALSVRMAFDAARRAGVRNPFVALTDMPPTGVRPLDDFLRSWRRIGRAAPHTGAATLIAIIAGELDLLGPVRDGGVPPGWDATSSPARLSVLVEAARDLESVSRSLGEPRVAPTRFVDEIEEIAGLLSDPIEPPRVEGAGVHLMSIHAAKGLEFDVVIVPRAIDGVMPQRARGHALLPPASLAALRRLSPTLFAGDQDVYQEECSLWYVALTRARREVVVTWASSDEDDIELPPSPFTQAIEDRSATPDREKRALRRPIPGIAAVAPVPRKDWPPVRLAVDHLSPKSVETYLACPRRFFYSDVLRLQGERDEETTLLGSILHATLAAFHETERDFTSGEDLAARRERWRAALLSQLDIAAAEEARRASLALDSGFMRYEIALARNYVDEYVELLARDALAAPFEVLASEFAINAEIDGVRFTGRADRVDRLAAGGLAIRDYKSGKTRGKTVKGVREALDRLDERATLAGDAPSGLHLQTLLYAPGVEAHFRERVALAQYIYFRGKGKGEGLETDSLAIVDDESAASDTALTRSEVERAQRDIAAAIAHSLEGGISAFSTALAEQTCRFCDYVQACPGAMTIS